MTPARRAEAPAACAQARCHPLQSRSAAPAPRLRGLTVRRYRTLLVRFLPDPWPLRHDRSGLFHGCSGLFRGVVEAPRQARFEFPGECLEHHPDTIEADPGGARIALTIGRAIDLDLERVDAASRTAVALDHMATGKRLSCAPRRSRAAAQSPRPRRPATAPRSCHGGRRTRRWHRPGRGGIE